MHSLVVSELLDVHASAMALTGSTTTATGGGGAGGGAPHKLSVCMAEIYLDTVRDLGAEGSAGTTDLTPSASTAVAGVTSASTASGIMTGEIALTWHPVKDAAEAEAKVSTATLRRVTADNGINAQSSRSHLVVVYALCAPNGERRGQIALVDLAGSERLARTEATGERREEAVSINKSLSALGDVLHALIGKTEHVPYRNSRLTTLLQPCLRRGCRVALIVAASPSTEDAAETMHTLGFGVRARSCALGPIATVGAGGRGGMAGGGKAGGAAAAGELGRVQKQLVEARAASVAAEKVAATLKQQATAAEDGHKASAAAAKRADARIKELEAALERREHAATSERTRMQKEQSDLQRRLDVALRGRRNQPAVGNEKQGGAQQAAAVAASAPVTRAPSEEAPPPPNLMDRPVPTVSKPVPPPKPTPKASTAPVTPAAVTPAARSSPPRDGAGGAEGEAAFEAAGFTKEVLRRLSSLRESSALSPRVTSSSAAMGEAQEGVSEGAAQEEQQHGKAAGAAPALDPAEEAADCKAADGTAAEGGGKVVSDAEVSLKMQGGLMPACDDENCPPAGSQEFSQQASSRLSMGSDDGTTWLQPRLSLATRESSFTAAEPPIEVKEAEEEAEASTALGASAAFEVAAEAAAAVGKGGGRMMSRLDSFDVLCSEMTHLAQSPMPALGVPPVTPSALEAATPSAATPTAPASSSALVPSVSAKTPAAASKSAVDRELDFYIERASASREADSASKGLGGGPKRTAAKAGVSVPPLKHFHQPPGRVPKTPKAAGGAAASKGAVAEGAAPLTCPARVTNSDVKAKLGGGGGAVALASKATNVSSAISAAAGAAAAAKALKGFDKDGDKERFASFATPRGGAASARAMPRSESKIKGGAIVQPRWQ